LPHPDHPNDRSLFIGAEPGQNLGQKQLEDLVSFFCRKIIRNIMENDENDD
jgi:hypothetical protein